MLLAQDSVLIQVGTQAVVGVLHTSVQTVEAEAQAGKCVCAAVIMLMSNADVDLWATVMTVVQCASVVMAE